MENTTTTYVGTVEGTDAYIALLWDGTKALAVVCDGERMGLWLAGSLGADGLWLASSLGAWADAKVSEDDASGTLHVLDGSSYPFAARQAQDRAGLYRTELTVDGRRYLKVDVVLNDGSTRTQYTLPRAGDLPFDVPAPPPDVAEQLAGAATPRSATKDTKIEVSQQTRCTLSVTAYHHIYDLWVEHRRPRRGPLYDDLVKAWNHMIEQCENLT